MVHRASPEAKCVKPRFAFIMRSGSILFAVIPGVSGQLHREYRGACQAE